ncbi:hypothetical protein BKA93DRAFT_827054 [Sparassis latifolia]
MSDDGSSSQASTPNAVIPDPFNTSPAFESPAFAPGSGDDHHPHMTPRKFPRISKPVELLRPTYDVVVVGSGYGGGVAASRMARGGQSVCVLERGKERWRESPVSISSAGLVVDALPAAGEYPSTLAEAAPNVRVQGRSASTKGAYVEVGDPMGLYHLTIGEGQNVFVGNGLGGTSLLNANIFLEADKGSLSKEDWPEDIKNDPTVLDKYYERAASVLQPESYPESYPPLDKLKLLETQAEKLGWQKNFYRPPQTTRFEDGPNSTGVMMYASTGSGMDSTGVNDGSKSSTLVNYLSDAWNWGAEIFCESEVRYVQKAPNGEGYIVFFAWHGTCRSAFRSLFDKELMWVHAKKFVFLGAGTLGTTEILLRSKQLGLPMSRTVGMGMSGNGDILAFGYNTDYEAHALGRAYVDPARPVGPTITGVIDRRAQANPLDGFVIEEGAVPEALVPNLQLMLNVMPGKVFPKPWGPIQRLRHFVSRQVSQVLGPYTSGGSTERTQVYLIMSHDSNQATLTLNGEGKPLVKFLGVGRSEHVKYLNGVLAKATNVVGGTFINSPFYALFDEQEITVHPIGGANFSSDGTADQGATTQYGELLTGNGTEHHNGLVCVDGSVIPTALGVNPFATITALAERSVEHVAVKNGVKIDYDTPNGLLDLTGPPARRLDLTRDLKKAIKIINSAKAGDSSGVQFSEVMEGFMYVGNDIEDFTVAENAARGVSSSARFFLSVHGWDVRTLVHQLDHPAMLTGTFTCGALSKHPFMVLRGTFQLFSNDPRTPDTQNLVYNFDMLSVEGEVLHFNGYKVVNPSVAFSVWRTWKATSTLYVTITRPRDKSVVARGVLRIAPLGFGSELTTFAATGSSLFSRLGATGQFLTYFTKQTANFLFAPLSMLQWPSVSPNGFIPKTPPAETTQVTAADGVRTTLHMWKPPATQDASTAQIRNDVPILFVPGAAVDQQIFAMPTLEVNAIEFFTRSGATCFCITHRVGRTPIAQNGWTTYDARLDVAAALEYIVQRYPQVYVIAHCAGSIALSMGLLDGTIPAARIKGVTASNVFMNPNFARVNMVKASLPVPLTAIYGKVAGGWFSCTSSPEDSFVQQAMNQALRFYPVGPRKEICNSVVCHRSELVFGRLWSHQNLNSQTHSVLSDFLGGVSMRALSHLMHMGTSGVVTTWPGPRAADQHEPPVSLVDKANLARLEGVPIFFFSGSENVVYAPSATDVSYTTLRNAFVRGRYERDVFDGFGHLDCWMGERAAGVVWPRVRQHIIKVCGK